MSSSKSSSSFPVSNEPAFKIHRLSPEEALDILEAHFKENKPTEPKSYNITTDEQRFALIKRVTAKELTIKQAARIYGLKYTTAKTVWKIYKREGRVEKKKQRSKKRSKATEMARSFGSSPGRQTDSQSKAGSQKGALGLEKQQDSLGQEFWAVKMAQHFA